MLEEAEKTDSLAARAAARDAIVLQKLESYQSLIEIGTRQTIAPQKAIV